MDAFLGLLGLLLYIVGVVGLAALVTLLVIKISPSRDRPKKRRGDTADAPQA